MFKPLLRTLPSLNGNIKLVCFLNNYEEVEDHVFEANVRTARLNAISSQLYNKYFNVSLLQSSYEWDVRSFYKKYSDWFYKKLFDVNQKDLPMYDEFGTNKNRNTDFEFGLKRVSYLKSNKQFGFFAPIYIENENDLPDYFEINIDIQNNVYKANRKIRVNVGNHLNDSSNYLGRYIYDYAKKIDNNVVYLNKDDNEAIYYGIDVISGGFGVKHDSVISSIFNKQNSILNYDNSINAGFERNKLIIRQIIPLSFYFSLNDILSEVEKSTFYGAEMTVSGKWIKDGLEVRLQDFYIDYLNFKPTVLTLNTETGGMQHEIPTMVDKAGMMTDINIMNIGYPSMKESLFYKYRFTNKFTPNFNRWKLKYSDDNSPYVCNVSAAFSLYQGSKMKYGAFPNNYGSTTGMVSKRPYYLNLILPLNGGEKRYDASTVDKYKQIQNNFVSNWFEIFYSIEDVLNKSVKVDDNKAYFNGIMYNLQNIYDSSDKELGKIDRFGVFINPIFNQLSDKQIREDNIYATNTIFKENSKYVTKPNCHINDNALSTDDPRIFANMKTVVKRDELAKNKIFVRNENYNGDFIPLNKYGLDWYDCNDFIKLSDIAYYISTDDYVQLKKEATEGYDIVPIYHLSNIVNTNGCLFDDIVKNDNLFISDFGSQSKIKVEKGTTNIVSDSDIKNKFKTYSKLLYRQDNFIDRKQAITLFKDNMFKKIQAQYQNNNAEFHLSLTERLSASYISIFNNASSYQYNPVLATSGGENYAFKTFTETLTIAGKFYGDDLRTYDYNKDYDFIWVDPYNLNRIVHRYNNTWLKKAAGYEQLAYIIEYNKYDNAYSDNEITITGWVFYDVLDQMKRGITNIKYDNKYLLNVISSAYNRCKIAVKEEPYVLDLNGEPTNRKWPDGKSRYRACISVILKKTGQTLRIIYNPTGLHTSEEEVYKYFESNGNVTINGKEFCWHILNGLLGFICLDSQFNFDYNDIGRLNRYINCFLYSLNIPAAISGRAPAIVMDQTNSYPFYCKFLNQSHFRYYLKYIFNGVDGYSDTDAKNVLLNQIFVRKRFVKDDMTVKDAFIPLSLFIKINSDSILTSTKDEREAEVSRIVSLIDFDKDTETFFFKNFSLKGEYYYVDSRPIRQKYVADPKELTSIRVLENGESEEYIDNKKFRFDLVYYKRMLKVDENIWRMINLEEEHEAPYKDLYLFEVESDEEFNKTIPIHYFVNDDSRVSVPIKRGVLKPLFNIATIEDKDESKIYLEYSINNVTKTKWEDWEQVYYKDYYSEYEDEEGNVHIDEGNLITTNEKIFFRHNANNEIAMYDLSTLNRDIPLDIKGNKYFYKNEWNEDRLFDYSYSFIKSYLFKTPEEHLNATYEYIDNHCKYFEHTYDLFGLNNIEFSKYSTYENVSYITGTYSYEFDTNIAYVTFYNEKDYLAKFAYDTNMMSYYEYGKNFTEAGQYPLDSSELETAYITKQIIPPAKPLYRILAYNTIKMEGIGELIEDKTVYTYHDALNIYDDWKLNTYRSETYTYINEFGIKKTGIYENVYTYAFYLIDVNMNNTTNSFNVECEDGDYIKYISYINGVNLAEHGDIVKDLYKQIVPFVKNNPLRYVMTNAYTVMPPKIFSLPLDYHPSPVMNNNKLAYYDVICNKGKYGTAAFERYFDNIVPMTKETSNFITYNMKYKNMKKSFRPTYFTNETIYPLDTSINFYPGVRVYNMNRPSEYETKYDYEWKHFNDNRGINLEESFSYTFDTYLTKNEVAINESKTRVFDIFKDHIINHTTTKLDDNGIQWAFTKYQITFGCEPVEVDMNNEDKLYKLDINFTLF